MPRPDPLMSSLLHVVASHFPPQDHLADHDPRLFYRLLTNGSIPTTTSRNPLGCQFDVPVLRQPKSGHRVIWGDQHARAQQGYAASLRRRCSVQPRAASCALTLLSLMIHPSPREEGATKASSPHQPPDAAGRTLPLEGWSLELCSGSGQPGDNRFLLLAVCGRRARGNASVRENRHRIASV